MTCPLQPHLKRAVTTHQLNLVPLMIWQGDYVLLDVLNETFGQARLESDRHGIVQNQR